jgi:hypothetical protein
MMPNGKASAVAPKLSDGDHVELSDMLPGGLKTNTEEDIMHLARLGDVPAIEKLYESGKFDASYCDAEGITPLHVFAAALLFVGGLLTLVSSGPQSTINMQCASFSSRLARM